MPLIGGLFRVQQSPSPNRPHILGHVVPRQADDPLFVVANDDTGTDGRLIVYPNRVQVAADLDVQGSILGYAEDPHGNEAHTENFLSEAVIDGLATQAALDAHTNATSAHGAAGALVGVNNTQTLTNKTLTAPVLNTEITGSARATTQEAEAGTSVTKVMTPARVSEAIDSRAPGIGLGWELIDDRSLTSDVQSIQFNGLSTDYREFRLEFVSRIVPFDGRISIRFNNQLDDHYWRMVTRRSDQAGSTEAAETDVSVVRLIPDSTPADTLTGVVRIAKTSLSDRATVHAEVVAGIGASRSEYYDTLGFWQEGASLITQIHVLMTTSSGSALADGSRFLLYGRRSFF